jgi:hypothetical protein
LIIRDRATGQIFFEHEWRQWILNNNGPTFDILSTEILDEYGADPVFDGAQATGGTVYQYSMQMGVEQIGDKWYTKYVLGPIFTDITQQDGTIITAAEQEQDYKNRKDAEESKSVRQQRNSILSACDWTQVADAPVDSLAWANYRQALRDLPQQPEFPWNITWPSEPT